METMLNIDLDTIIYIGSTVALATVFIMKIKGSQDNTANLIKSELGHMKEIHENTKKEFKESIEVLKADLKEDISRLEAKQQESNNIKERLAKTEYEVDKNTVTVERINNLILSKVLDKLDK